MIEKLLSVMEEKFPGQIGKLQCASAPGGIVEKCVGNDHLLGIMISGDFVAVMMNGEE